MSTIKAKFYWKPSDGSDTNSVIWGIQANALTHDEAIDDAFGTAVTVTQACTGTDNDLHITNATGDVTIAGSPGEGKLVIFQVYRDANAGGDNYDNDAHLLGVNIQYREVGTPSQSW